MRLKDRVAVVTGAARGIGLSCARLFSAEGAKVVLADIDEPAGKAAAAELVAAGYDVQFAYCDVGERLDVHNLIATTLDVFDRIDVFVNNAGVMAPDTFLDLDDADFDKVIRVNLRGAFLCAQAAATTMVRQMAAETAGGGVPRAGYSIINMSSVNAVVAAGDNAADAAAKGGLNQLTRAMAVALAPHGIRVNAIGPGSIATGLPREMLADGTTRESAMARTPLGRIGSPDEIAAIAVFLASDEASYVTGQCIYADGGRLALNLTVPVKD